MIEKLAQLEKTHEELTERLVDPAVLSDPKTYRELNKALSEIAEAVRTYREYKKVERERAENEALLATLPKDDDLYPLAQEERAALQARFSELEEELRRELTP